MKMKTTLLATVSASVIALAAPQLAQAQNQSARGLLNADPMALVQGRSAAEITEIFTQLSTLCNGGAPTPDGLDCALIDQIAQTPELQAALAQDPSVLQELMAGDDPDTANADAEVTEPAQEPEPAQDVPADEQAAEAPAAEAPADAAAPEPVEEALAQAAEAPADPAPQQADEAPAQTAEDANVGPTDADEVDALRDELAEQAPDEAPQEDAAEAPAPEPEAQPEEAAPEQTAEEVPPQQTAEEQAEAVAERDAQAANSAAARRDGNEADAEVVEETVDENDVRRSSEDFTTRLFDQTGQNADADDDNDNLRKFGTAALLGLGAVALNEILSDDEEVVSDSGDRIVIQQGDGSYRVLRNDDVLLRRPGADVQTQRYDDGSTRTVIAYDDGTQVETIRAADGRVLRRTRILQDGSEVVLFDDTRAQEDVAVNELPQTTDRRTVDYRRVEAEDLATALAAQQSGVSRSFSLNQIRNIDAVRQLVPALSVDTINFETNSAAIRPDEAEELAALGNAMRELIARNPGEVFLIEGHTDAVGRYSYNLALSDRRAESVALALTEYFNVPPENMVLQGYGESDLLVQTPTAERANRRAAVRRITPLLNGG